jgi:hypothetical protein
MGTGKKRGQGWVTADLAGKQLLTSHVSGCREKTNIKGGVFIYDR